MTPARWFAAALVALVAIGVGGYLAYDQFLRGDAVAPLSLASPSPAPSDAASASSDAASAPAASSTPPASVAGADVPGTWIVGAGSVAGYRVREKVASLSAQSDAVGRTESVTGEATLVASGETVQLSEARFEVDLTTLTSDEERRDRRLTEQGIESARFPTSTFTLSEPVLVPADALAGETVSVTLVGDLDLHGVTKTVEIPAEALLEAGRIEVAGSLTFPFADFGIVPPSIGGFVTVEDEGSLEFLVVLEKS